MANNDRNTNYYRKVGDGYVQHSVSKKGIAFYETLRLTFKIVSLPIYFVGYGLFMFFKIVIYDVLRGK